MPITVYGMPVSAPCRLVNMVCEVLEKQYEPRIVNIMQGDQHLLWFTRLNPQHTIPVLQDGDYVISESRAAACYLANKYDKAEKLYPDTDLKTRARIDQRLHFDAGTLYKRLADIIAKAATGKKVASSDFEKLHEALRWTADFVSQTGWVAGTDHLTLADISFVSTYSSVRALGNDIVNWSNYSELEAWFDRAVREIPNYEAACGEGASQYGAICGPMLKAASAEEMTSI